MLTCQKHQFSIDPNIHYLNNASYGPLPNVTAAAATIGIQQKVNPQLKKPADHYVGAERVRVLFRQLVNAEHANRIAIIPSASYGMAIVAANLHRLPNIETKTHFLTIENGFPNDAYAFTRVAKSLNLTHQYCDKPQHKDVGETWNTDLLAAISDQTAMVVVPHVHWIYGNIFDLEAIGKRCKKHGALLIIDGSQSIGAMPFDIARIKPDALICGAYKWLLGPYSIGLGYFGEFFDEGVPVEETWMNRANSDDFSNLTKLDTNYRPMAQRYNMGEFSQFIQLPMLEESLKLLLDWGIENIQEYTRKLTQIPIAELQTLGCLTEVEGFRAGHLFRLELPANIDVDELKKLLTEHNVYVSKPGSGLRISVNVFNNEADMQVLVNVISAAIKAAA